MKVKVRIALAVGPGGDWACAGWGGPGVRGDDRDKMSCATDSISQGEARYWLEAEVDAPEPTTIQATVTT